eukprot:1358669-Rhodomonas_salina.1
MVAMYAPEQAGTSAPDGQRYGKLKTANSSPSSTCPRVGSNFGPSTRLQSAERHRGPLLVPGTADTRYPGT